MSEKHIRGLLRKEQPRGASAAGSASTSGRAAAGPDPSSGEKNRNRPVRNSVNIFCQHFMRPTFFSIMDDYTKWLRRDTLRWNMAVRIALPTTHAQYVHRRYPFANPESRATKSSTEK